MIESAEIENFRGFVKADLKDLRRFNIVVGDNGAGKTVLLEALFAASAASPEVILKLRSWRAMPIGGAAAGQQEFYSSLWGDLFNDFDLKKVISVSLYGTETETRSVRIFVSSRPTILPLTEEVSLNYAPSAPVTFEWKHPFGDPVTSTPELGREGLIIPPTPDTTILGSFLAARVPFNAAENASRYSDLSKKNEEMTFVSAMRSQFKDIEKIGVELEYGTPMLFVKYDWQDRKLPIHILSDGMNKIAAILLSISAQSKRVVFVDEIDTGIYFKRYSSFVDQVHHYCTIYNTQVFASTHSLEFLRAVVPTMKKNPDDFSLVRVYRRNGHSEATVISGDEALSLIESGLEVRV